MGVSVGGPMEGTFVGVLEDGVSSRWSIGVCSPRGPTGGPQEGVPSKGSLVRYSGWDPCRGCRVGFPCGVSDVGGSLKGVPCGRCPVGVICTDCLQGVPQ
jgi:hypothetical protein